MLLKNKNGIDFLQSELFLKYGVPHAFTTRRGGVSSGAFESLNVSTRRRDFLGNTDEYQNTVQNFSRVLSLVGACAENSVCAHQVHGNNILTLSDDYAGMGILKSAALNVDADGLYADSKESFSGALCVKSADCTPILLADVKRGAVCAVHSGRRGTVLDIPGEAVKAMVSYGSEKENIICAIGPCIGACCYEVGEEVYLEAEKTLNKKGAHNLIYELFTDKKDTDNGTKYHFNIGRMCAYLLELSGVYAKNIDFMNICTCCSEDEKGRIFFSHRGQNGHSGTFANVIAPFECRKETI